MSRFLKALGVVLILSVPAVGQVTGDTYTITGQSFPDDYFAVPVTFDGIEEPVGGMLVNEMTTPFSGIPGGLPILLPDGTTATVTSFEQTGELVEWWFRTPDGGRISNNSNGFGFLIEDLEWNIPGLHPLALSDTSFFYFTHNGDPIPIPPALATAFGVSLGKHPTDPSLDVIYFADSLGDLGATEEFADGTVEISAGIGAEVALIEFLLGDPTIVPINDIHLGGIFTQVPEPATLTLLGVVGIPLLLRRRRRR